MNLARSNPAKRIPAAALPLAAAAVYAVDFAVAQPGAHASGDSGPGALPERLSAAARQVFGVKPVADLFAFEVTMIVYALAGWWMKPAMEPRSFTSHRESGWSAALVGLVLLLLVEGFPVHVMAARAHPMLAWLLTAATLYSLLWLFGDFHGLRLRPMRFTEDALWVRLGLRWNVRVPFAQIRAVVTPNAETEAALKRETLRAVLIGEASVVLELTEPLVATGPYGLTRRVKRIALAPDDRRAFMAELAAALPPCATPRA